MTEPEVLEAPAEQDRVVHRDELLKTLRVSSETVRRWLASGKLPAPDVDITRCSRAWRLSTLRQHGINLA
jgi:hypothetical protein